MTASRSRSALSPVFWVLFWGTLVNRSASFVVVFLALHLTQDIGITKATAGWIVGCWGIGGWLASPVAGVLTDQIGRRATMLLGLVLGGACVLAIAFASGVGLLFGLAFLGGATQQLFFPACNAAIADVVPAPDRPRAYGLIYWAANLGLAIGFVVGGLVPDRYIWLLFIADAGTTFVCAAVVAWRVPETRPATTHHESALRGLARVAADRTFLAFAGLHLLSLMIFTQFQLALPLDMKAHGHGSRGFSWLMAFNCAGVVVLQPWLARRLRRFDGSRLLAIASLLFGLGYGLNALVPGLASSLAELGLGGAHAWSLALYLAGSALWTVGEVIGFPVASTLVADLAPVALRGRYQGAFSMVWGMSMGFSPIVGGQMIDRFGAPALWALCLCVGTAVAAGHLIAAPARRERLAVLAADRAN
ncbi:MAG TPA: MFS transporter [Kofleriaceae bacterium]|jgi:MFS family permease|nr:MFS transporter [Kofleriaceae bacterium]